MAKAAAISARMDPELKRNAEKIFKKLGLTTTQAITIFYKQVELQRGLPFGVQIPNETTTQALEEARTRQNLANFNTLDDLLEALVGGRELAAQLRDHVLVGQYKGTRECHLEPDWLLIYESTESELVLIRTGSHSDLFR
jgi:DNA-damage-inducible protein J